jgi:hypothetical protein
VKWNENNDVSNFLHFMLDSTALQLAQNGMQKYSGFFFLNTEYIGALCIIIETLEFYRL